MVRILRVSLFVVAVLSLLAAVQPASAQTVDECQAIIAQLRSETAAVESFTNAKDQEGLLGKLDSALAKIEQGKVADAEQALTQFRDKVALLESQGKIAHEDASALIARANEAIACVRSLSTT